MNNGAACCANSLFTQIVAVCSYFPPSKHQDERESKKTGEQESAEWTRSRLVRWSRRREQNELDPLGGRFGSLLLQRPSASSTTAAFPDKAKLFHPENIFLLTHRSGTESPVWQVALFPLQDVPLRPPSKKRPGLSDRQPARQHRGQRLLSFNICFI